MSRVLVIGAAGYIGSAVYRHLEKAGHEVSGRDALLRGNPGKVPLLDDADEGGWDTVVWLAGASNVGQAMKNPTMTMHHNVSLLAFLAERCSGRLIYASSGSVYNGTHNAVEADSLYPPVNAYDASKMAADLVIPHVHPNSFGLRFGTVCGPSPNTRWELILNAMVRDAITKRVVKASTRDFLRPILAIGDLCRAVEKLVDGRGQPGIYNLASMLATAREYALEVTANLGGSVEEWTGTPSAYDFSMDCGKAVRELGWTPEIGCGDLIAEIAAAVKAEKVPV